MPKILEKKPIYKCKNGTCKRLFKTQQNSEQHFCWNVKIEKPIVRRIY